MSNPNSTFSKIVGALTALQPSRESTLAKQNGHRALQKKLEKAKPAEVVWNTDDYVSAGGELTSIHSCADPGDGMWLCCCGTENALVHYQGDHPFKYLSCRTCNHVVCTKCRTTEILTRIHPTRLRDLDPRYYSRGPEALYCRVCSACGLTHRAKIFDGSRVDFREDCCPCGKTDFRDDFCCHLGSYKNWRLDTEGRAVAMRLEWKFAARERSSERSPRSANAQHQR